MNAQERRTMRMDEKPATRGTHRREFVARMGAAGVGAALVSAAPGTAAGGAAWLDRGHPAGIAWEDLVGDVFHLCGSPFDESARPAVLVLREVERGSYAWGTRLPVGVSRHWCSLIFEVRTHQPVASATHVVEHRLLGRFAAFANHRPDPRHPEASLCEISFN